MLGKSAILAVALALGAVHAATADAAGMCFRYADSDTFTVKSPRVPRRNKCAPFNGVEISAPGAALSGMSCTSADGETLVVHFTVHDFSPTPRSRFDSATCRFQLPLPAYGPQQGECSGMMIYQQLGSAPYLNRYSQPGYLGTCDRDVSG